MKIYATTVSDRATKGQGGNKDLLTVFTAEVGEIRQEIASVSLIAIPSEYILCFTNPQGSKTKYRIKS